MVFASQQKKCFDQKADAAKHIVSVWLSSQYQFLTSCQGLLFLTCLTVLLSQHVVIWIAHQFFSMISFNLWLMGIASGYKCSGWDQFHRNLSWETTFWVQGLNLFKSAYVCLLGYCETFFCMQSCCKILSRNIKWIVTKVYRNPLGSFMKDDSPQNIATISCFRSQG